MGRSTAVVKICPPPTPKALRVRTTCACTTRSADAVSVSTSAGPCTIEARRKKSTSTGVSYYGTAPPPGSRASQEATRQAVSGSMPTPQALPQSEPNMPCSRRS